jgi:acetoin utilization deacetylase AcuC-like enzyme
MKVVYHPRYEEVYASDPAAAAGRMESIIKEVWPHFESVMAEPATIGDISLVHSDEHIKYVQRMALTYEIALLAAGGAIRAAELAAGSEPAFALIRPPGHHASRDHCWGFCFFNNMAISIAKLRKEGKIETAVIVDIDLHFGDGTANIFENIPQVIYFHPEGRNRQEFVDGVSRFLAQTKADVVAVSAGFDRHEEDWGGLLKTEDYETIGKLVKECAERVCQGNRYGVLEGGYNHNVLGRNVKALLKGMS